MSGEIVSRRPHIRVLCVRPRREHPSIICINMYAYTYKAVDNPSILYINICAYTHKAVDMAPSRVPRRVLLLVLERLLICGEGEVFIYIYILGFVYEINLYLEA